ncbi:peptidylprolyl isomerase [Gulosibacter bifidus]|uniref:Peptidyl-prolyl cis-trans isomerase n=1 Tax=Gulosibacter bifidus TaxID=272239 RepID=A0ABW5RM50_9MICO|nr:peptidylprolyl isomerase [Gulosibacter bifidus]
MTNATAVMTLHTNHGDIKLNLFGNHAPNTVKVITGLATGELEWVDPVTGESKQEPFYSGVIFHRIIREFMLQGGDRTGTGTGGPGFNFDDEIHPELDFTKPYMLAMANAGRIAGRGTNGSQFFITTAPTTWLQGKHTIFGEVADDASKKVVDELDAIATNASDRPLEDVVIESVDVVAL